MPTYVYTARTPDGKKTTGKLDAHDAGRVAVIIKKYGFLPIKITEYKQSFFEKEMSLSFDFIKTRDILLFTRQLATLLGAGLTLLGSLDSIGEQSGNKSMKAMVDSIREAVAGGNRFSEALHEYPKHFSAVYTNMIMVGEKGGILVEILKRLALLIEYEENIRIKVKKATRYPIMVLVALGIAGVIIVVFVLPNFMGMFSMLGSDLPLPTRILINISNYVTRYWILIIGIIFGTAYAINRYIRTETGKYRWDWMAISIPIIGELLHKLIVSRFARVLAMLNESGLAILDSIDIVSKTTDNVVIAKALVKIKEKIRAGEGIAAPMKESGLFPSTVVNMVAIGEKSGNLTEMLFKIADYFDEDVDVALDNLSAMIEPILIGFLAILVLFVATAVFLPMWNMINLIG
ncbi:MAG: type II secretion system F family protein [Candidatus Margulisiibacteriota bacterium]